MLQPLVQTFLREAKTSPRFVQLVIDSKLRGCDLVRLQTDDVCVGGRVRDRATVMQNKTGKPVQFEITEQTTRSGFKIGFPVLVPGAGDTSFRVGFGSGRTSRRDNTLALSMDG